MAAKIIPKKRFPSLGRVSLILGIVVATATIIGFIYKLAVWVESINELQKENAELVKRLNELSNQQPELTISADKLVGNWCLRFGEPERGRVRISTTSSGENRIDFNGQELRGDKTLRIVGQGTVIGKIVSVYYSMMDGEKVLWNGDATFIVHSQNLLTGTFDNDKGKSGTISLIRV